MSFKQVSLPQASHPDLSSFRVNPLTLSKPPYQLYITSHSGGCCVLGNAQKSSRTTDSKHLCNGLPVSIQAHLGTMHHTLHLCHAYLADSTLSL